MQIHCVSILSSHIMFNDHIRFKANFFNKHSFCFDINWNCQNSICYHNNSNDVETKHNKKVIMVKKNQHETIFKMLLI